MLFTVYDAVTGDVFGSGSASEKDARLQEQNGRKVLLGIALDAATQKVNLKTLEAEYSHSEKPRELIIADIIAERERRLAMGFDYDFGDDRGVHRISTTRVDWAGWDDVTRLANAAVNSGSGGVQISIETDTGPAVVTAIEWQSIMMAAGAFGQPIHARSFELMRLDPMPQNAVAIWEGN